MFEIPFETPVQVLRMPVFESYGVEVSIKRDDMIHPFISGNKWRKLKYVIDDAQLQDKKILVSFGGAYSNHLLALACAGATSGFTTVGFVRGDAVTNPMLSLCRIFGMELNFVSREDYSDKRKLFDQHFGKNPKAYFIDEGGRGMLAVKGCEEILAQHVDFDRVICAVGTGTTLVGIAQAAKRQNRMAEGVCVLKGAGLMDLEIEQMAGFQVKVHHAFHCGGYAKTNPELMQWIHAIASQTGILLDQVYTGKMALAVKILIEQGYYKRGERLLLIHTGGLMGLLSQL
ncbi:MAG: pyridoxal-phosphate dependent enzyme [Bacteroidia bacterium]|jgi:1-aminocyclopropane-1-carboxylate deaminase